MAETKKIKTALVSVFHKDGLDELLKELNNQGVKFLSTGGTQSFIESLGYECQAVEDLTTYPSILGGRVKTLHPKVFGGILGRRENEGDKAYAMQVFLSRKGLHLGKMETTDVDGGEAMWAVDMEGDYPYQNIISADDDGKNVTFWYIESAPEHIDMGYFRIVNDEVKQHTYSSNYVWVN